MFKKLSCLLFVVAVLFIITGCNDDNNGNQTQDEPENNTEQNEEQASEQNENDQSADSETENEEEGTQKEKVTLSDLEPIPTDEQGLANQMPGPLANADSLYDMENEIEEHMSELPSLSENPTDEEYETYLRYIYWLVAEDYPDPEDTVKKWEFASFGNPDLPDAKFHFKENYNIEIILDSSGSMANPAGNGTRMDVAKESINSFLSEVPEEARVSLRVYGHEGSSADSDKELSCGSIEQVYGFGSYTEENFQNALDQFQPSGWTPLADSLKQSQEALEEFDAENHTNLIYVVSDGIETCDGDPVSVAESLSGSNAQPIVNIIGFQTDAEAQEQLEEMAEVSGGIFTSAQNEEELEEEFNRAEEVLDAWEDWKDGALSELDAKETDSTFDIMELHNKWSFTTTSIQNEMKKVVNVTGNIDVLTLDQRNELKSKIDEVTEEISTTAAQLESDLEDLRDKNFEEAKQQVEEKYSEQTEN